MQLMEMKAWISTLPGSPLPTQAAEAAGIDRSTMSRQLKRGNLQRRMRSRSAELLASPLLMN